jgi:acyl-CoA synthetase (AMP-forming)/AMP-acid ligase II
MADLGFWRLAEADPAHLALVGPDGTERTAGELLAAANRAAHGLRALGLEAGDTVALLLPNSIELIEIYLGALQIGLYVTPINWHLVGPEVAYILSDSDAKVFVAHERLRRRRRRRSRRGRLPRRPPLRRGRPSTGSARWPSSPPASPTPPPRGAPPVRPCTTRRAPPVAPRA